MTGKYTLDGKNPVIELDLLKWAKWFGEADRTVAKTIIGDDIEISTVFLGIDYDHTGEGPPILFETLVFGGTLDGEMYRYETWEQAEKGHEAMVQLVEAAGA